MSLSESLVVKLGSILVHVDEGCGPGGHEFDLTAAVRLIHDPEVQEWLGGIDPVFLPVRREVPE